MDVYLWELPFSSHNQTDKHHKRAWKRPMVKGVLHPAANQASRVGLAIPWPRLSKLCGQRGTAEYRAPIVADATCGRFATGGSRT